MGTILGLLVKYILDRQWIFKEPKTSFKINRKKFSLYSLIWYVWQTNEMREFGAIIGLCAGYTLKYNLDSRYVFNKKRLVF